MTKARDLANGGFGLVLIKPSSVVNGTDNGKGTVSFSAASSVSLNDVFNATYDSYRIVLSDFTAATGSQVLNIRWRVSGSDNTTSNYQSINFYAYSSSAADQSLGATSAAITTISEFGNLTFDVLNPFVAKKTAITGTGMSYQTNVNAFVARFYGSAFNATTSFTGFTIYPSSSTITGTVSVYGYNK